MIDHGPATEDEMILAFLQAELFSPRFGPQYTYWLAQFRRTPDIITNPDLTNAGDNAVRKTLLTNVRGYANKTYLFRGFPPDVQWHHVTLEQKDIDELRYANYPTWTALSGGTRRVADGARHLHTHPTAENADQNVPGVIQALRKGTTFPPLIAASNGDGPLVLIEGHTRATAYLIAGTPTDVIVGTSPHMTEWGFW